MSLAESVSCSSFSSSFVLIIKPTRPHLLTASVCKNGHSYQYAHPLQFDFAFHQEAQSISPVLILDWPCYLIWPTEYGRSDGVPVPRADFKSVCTLPSLSWNPSQLLDEAYVSILDEGRPQGAEQAIPAEVCIE